MQKTCKKCGAANADEGQYCGKCGGALHQHGHERTSESQAVDIRAMARHHWLGLSMSERIMAVGAAVAVVAFVLPWASVGPQSLNGFSAGNSNASYLYLLPILMIASLVLLFVARHGSDSRRAFMARWQIVIGSVAATAGMAVIVFINSIGGLLSVMGGLNAMLGGSGFSVSAGIGTYLYILGAIAVVVGAFRRGGELQKD